MRTAPLTRRADTPTPREAAHGKGDAAEAYRLKAANLVNEFQLACSKAALDRLLILIQSDSESASRKAEILARTALEQKKTLERELNRFLSVTDPDETARDCPSATD